MLVKRFACRKFYVFKLYVRILVLKFGDNLICFFKRSVTVRSYNKWKNKKWCLVTLYDINNKPVERELFYDEHDKGNTIYNAYLMKAV